MNREELGEMLVSSALMVAQKTNHPRALQVMNMLTRYVLHVPSKEGTEYIRTKNEIKDTEPLYKLVPVLPEDASLSEFWAHVLANRGAAEAKPGFGLIIIKCWAPMSWSTCGLLMLHEGEHALSLMERPRNWKERSNFIQDEIEAHKFQNALQSLLGGETYKQWLEAQIEEFLRAGCVRADGTFSFQISRQPVPKLDQVFGTSLSEYEDNLRSIFFRCHAAMECLVRGVDADTANAALRAFFECHYQDFIPSSE